MAGTLPVWAVIKGTYAAVFRDFSDFVAKICLWLVLTWLASFGIGYLTHALPEAVTQFQVTMLILVPMYAGIAVLWHRHVQLREERKGLATLRFGFRELKVFVMGTMLTVGVWGPLVLGAGILATGRGPTWALGLVALYAIALSIAFIYVSIRLGMAFPLAATDERRVFDQSWTMLRGKVLRLFVVLVVAYYPVAILVGKLAEVGLLAIHRKSFILALFIHALIIIGSALIIGLIASALSVALMHLRGIPITPANHRDGVTITT